jgi:hypothetical protein
MAEVTSRTGSQETVVAGHRQYIADASALQLGQQPGVGAVDLVAGYPGGRHPGVQRPREHGRGQGRLGGEPDLVGTPAIAKRSGSLIQPRGTYSSRSIMACPGIGGVEQVDGDLGVLDPAGGADALALHPTV